MAEKSARQSGDRMNTPDPKTLHFSRAEERGVDCSHLWAFLSILEGRGEGRRVVAVVQDKQSQ